MMIPYKVMPEGVQEVMTTKWVVFSCLSRCTPQHGPQLSEPFCLYANSPSAVNRNREAARFGRSDCKCMLTRSFYRIQT